VKPRPVTLAAVDRALDETRTRLLEADAAADQLAIDVIWLRLDDLLDQRLHLPAQRINPDRHT
jgi:hypothetical protein